MLAEKTTKPTLMRVQTRTPDCAVLVIAVIAEWKRSMLTLCQPLTPLPLSPSHQLSVKQLQIGEVGPWVRTNHSS